MLPQTNKKILRQIEFQNTMIKLQLAITLLLLSAVALQADEPPSEPQKDETKEVADDSAKKTDETPAESKNPSQAAADRLIAGGAMIVDLEPRSDRFAFAVSLSAKQGDEAVRDAALIPYVMYVDASKSQVTDSCMVFFSYMPYLSELSLADCEITDTQMKNLAAARRLTKLNLSGTQVGNEGVAYLQGLGNLKELNLTGTKVSDEGMGYLIRLGRLTRLIVLDTKVTAATAQALQRQMVRYEQSGPRYVVGRDQLVVQYDE